MRRIVAVIVLVALVAALAPVPAEAGSTAAVALGLASFAVFNQLAFGVFAPRAWAVGAYPGYYYPPYAAAIAYPGPMMAYPPVAYASPPVSYYAAPPSVTYAAPPAPRPQNEVVYPHGRYVLRGDGVTTAYQWVWIPNPPPGPPPAPPPTR